MKILNTILLRVTIFTIVIISCALTSCNKFLDKNPDNRTELNSVDKVRDLLKTAYPQAAYQKICELMSDNALDKSPISATKNMDSTYFAFGDFISSESEKDSPTQYWSACYSAIAAANASLDAIDKAKNQQDYNAEKGEALVCRAYAHFMLVTLFAKPYNVSTASSDMGIPYVTKPEVTAVGHYERGTIQEDYDNIQKDLEEGIPLIDDNNYSVPKFHFTKVAANAFATRFYLYKGDYEKSINSASNAFSNSSAYIANMRNWNQYLKYTYAEFRQNYTNSTEKANLLLIECPSLWARDYYGSRFGFAPSFNQILFTATPSVAKANAGRWLPSKFVYIINGQQNNAIPKWIEYFYTPDDPNYGYPHVMTPVFTTEGVLFDQTEAYIRSGQFQNAINNLNTYLSQRLQSYTQNDNITESKLSDFFDKNGITDEKEQLLQTLLMYKRIEFVQEGMRWFDDLRFNIKITHELLDRNLNVVNTFTLDSTDNRRQWQLPSATIAAGIPENPR